MSKTGTTSRPVVNTVVTKTWRVTKVANNIQETFASDDVMAEAVEAAAVAAMRFGFVLLVILERQSAVADAAPAHWLVLLLINEAVWLLLVAKSKVRLFSIVA